MRVNLSGLLLMLMAATTQADKVTAVADPWPPFVDPALPSQGISMEIVRAAYATQGYDVRIDFMPWARAMKGVKEGRYDIIPDAWRTVEREAVLHFSEPYVSNMVRFIKRKGDPFEFTGMETLDNKTVGVTRGYAYSEAFSIADNFAKSEANDILQNVRRLVLKRIDLTLEDELVARALISREAPELLSKIEFTRQPLSLETLHVVSGKANPRHKTLIDAFNRGLEEIRANGTLVRILAPPSLF